MNKYIVTHTHKYGESTYFLQTDKPMFSMKEEECEKRQQEIINLFDIHFEPEKDEEINWTEFPESEILTLN